MAATKDPRLVPIYSVGEVAHHLRVPPSTVRSWVKSRGGPTPFQRVIIPDDRKGSRLSFRNLIEVHVLSSLRDYRIPLPRIRKAIGYLRNEFGTDHPLADVGLSTDHRDIFVRYLDFLIAVTKEGQVAFRPVIERYLDRIERDEEGLFRRLYPFVTQADTDRFIAIDPRRKFGRPYLVGAGVETSAIASRYRAGETVIDLAEDFETTKEQIEGALRFEKAYKEAA